MPLFLLALAVSTAEPVDYAKDVKPVLARCYACHGALQQKAGLRVDTAKFLREAKVVVPGKSGESPLVDHVLGRNGAAKMPPATDGEALTEKQVNALKAWIDAGANAPADEQADPDPREHWSFRKPVRPPVPAGSANPIDAFLKEAWKKQNLTPQPAADKRILLRRVYLDLTGLPPTAEEIAAFLADTSPNAFEKVVDHLLASPQYGERWGRHFLDIWRYSDWWGLGAELRNSQKHIWHWRDWVIERLNADAGYDQMIREMLAADELYPTDPEKLRATGFLARQYFKFNRSTWLEETVEHTSKAFLGLTANCSKCHDHKFDPISQNDFYRLRAIFEPYQVRTDFVPGELDPEKAGIPRAFDCNATAPTYKFERGDERKPLTNKVIAPGIPPLLAFGEFEIKPVTLPALAHSPQLQPFVVDAYRKAAMAEGELAVKAVEARAKADSAKVSGPETEFKRAAQAAAKAEKELAAAKAEQIALKAEWSVFTSPSAKRAEAIKKRDAAKAVLEAARKALQNPGENYTPLRGSVKTLESNLESEVSRSKPFPTTSTGRRTAFANWVADARNPLTARVAVNHVWARHFGQPLVATVFDFGRKGAKPTHPELLDWLAVEFTESKWSFKHLHRLIVTSQAYRMSSSSLNADAAVQADPENKFLWRQNSVRMEAQTIRDNLLALAGTLDRTLGGPPVPLSEQDSSRRRAMYFFQSHNEHHKFLSQFDDANVLECYRRTESVVPAQALTLANSRFAWTMAEAIAKRIPANSDDEFVIGAFGTILGTVPTVEEATACREALTQWRSGMPNTPATTAKARLNLVAGLLNHNDFVTIR